MRSCAVCGYEADMGYSCNFCGGYHCADHRLPEKHNCTALRIRKSSSETQSSGTGSDRLTVGTTPDPTYESSPDVEPDGSIQGETRRGRLAAGLASALSLLVGIVVLVLWLAVRLLARPRLWGLAFLAVLALSFTVGTGFAPLDQAVDDGYDAAVEAFENVSESLASEDGTAAGGRTSQSTDAGNGGGESQGQSTDPEGDTSLDREQLERAVHDEINRERSDRGLSSLQFDTALREVARYHSRDMVESDYFAHDSPDGETMGDRYNRFDYTCRVPTDGNRYLTGAENIYLYRGPPSVTEAELADEVVTGWMNSPGHRRNILTPEFRSEAIGVSIGDRGWVYVTQNFC